MLGDKMKMTINGNHCGVPVSFGFAYEQFANPDTGGDIFDLLVEGWFQVANAPWTGLRVYLSNQLTLECVTVADDERVKIYFLSGSTGQSASPSLPTPASLTLYFTPEDPWPGGEPGRCFIPGFLVGNTDQGAIVDGVLLSLRPIMIRIRDVYDRGGGLGPIFKLIPQYNYQTQAGPGASGRANIPYVDPFIRRMGSRRVDTCGAFQAGANNRWFTEKSVEMPVYE